VACGSETAETPTAETPTAETPTAETPAESESQEDSSASGSTDKPSGKIVVAGWPSSDDAFRAAEQLFHAEYPDIEIEYLFTTGYEHRVNLLTALAAGSNAPDVAMVEISWIGEARESTALEDLSQPPYNANRLADQFVDFVWERGKSLDGRQTAIPFGIGPATTFYRRDIFEEVGLPYEPEDVEVLLSTWDGFLEAAEKINIPNERWIVHDAAHMVFWLFLNYDFYNERLEFQLERPGLAEAYEAALTVRNNGWDAQMYQMWSTEVYAGLGGGGLASITAGNWYGGFLKTWVAPDTAGNWGVARLPAGIPDSNNGGSFLVIPSQSQNKEAAWAFVEFMMADPTAANIMFEEFDIFPALIPAWDDTSIYEAPDPFFAGQRTRALWVDIAENIEPHFTARLDSETEGLLLEAINVALNQGMNIQEAKEHIMDYITAMKREEREVNIDLLRDAGLWNDDWN
jgi:multiple sugar transport system substrate-binding protein